MHSDVLIVGYGPVGQLLAILLAQKGWNVTVVERWPAPYPMPRAVSYDGEAATILAATGADIDEFVEPCRDYVWTNADGQRLLEIDVTANGATSMYQPGLERALAARGAELPTLRVFRGVEATSLTDHGDHVSVVAGTREFTANWVVGCDGANSFVRSHLGIEVTDFGFASDWLICDVVLHDGREFSPDNVQICDPARPATMVSAGPGHRRWEFMRLPGEDADAGTAWRLLEPFDVHPGNAVLERHGAYTFQARLADQWLSGRVLLAGDAAHLMPPFAGQGLCSGFRDAANLAWKLDLVLRSMADTMLLDTYPAERRAHVRHAIGMSVNLGRVICQTDPRAAADRDAAMLRAKTRHESPLLALDNGFLRYGSNKTPIRPAGNLCPPVGLVGSGFVLLSSVDPRSVLDDSAQEFLARIGTHLVHVAGPGNVCQPLLARTRSLAMLVRPDSYIFGTASDQAELVELADELGARLGAVVRSVRQDS